MERSAGVIVFKEVEGEEKFLLLHYKYKSKYWGFPRGNIEEDESDEETALRELKEETGIEDVSLVDDFRERIQWVYERDGETVRKECTYFLARCDLDEDVSLSDEHIGYSWKSFDKAVSKLRFKNVKEVLKEANKRLSF